MVGAGVDQEVRPPTCPAHSLLQWPLLSPVSRPSHRRYDARVKLGQWEGGGVKGLACLHGEATMGRGWRVVEIPVDSGCVTCNQSSRPPIKSHLESTCPSVVIHPHSMTLREI